jgi:hypothetical protein
MVSAARKEQTVIGVALQHCARGWAIVPMRSNKRFYTRDGVKIATRDPKIVERWTWAEVFGLACGAASGVDVLDVDDPSEFPFDLTALLATTLAARTSRGVHLFFRYAGLRNRTFKWGEWRSDGLAVILPPAPSRVWLNNLMPATAPAELLQLVRRPTPTDSATAFSSWPLLGGDNRELPKPLYFAVRRAMPSASSHDQRRVMGALRKLVYATHHRNNALNRAAFCFRAFVAEGLTTTEQARALLEMASAMNGYTAKDGIADVRSTIASGLSGRHKRPGRNDKEN